MGNPGDVVVGQVDASQSSKAGERFRRQFRNEILLEATAKKIRRLVMPSQREAPPFTFKDAPLTARWCRRAK